MKKYLIIGDAGSMHVYNFVKYSLIGRDFEIYILSHSIIPIPVEYNLYYTENNIKVFTVNVLQNYQKRGVLSAFIKFVYKCKVIRELGLIDVCHFHYLNIYSCILYLLNRNRFNKLILTFWGSDILVKDKKSFWFRKQCLKYADRITISVSKTLRTFHEKYGHEFDQKVLIIRFMSGTIDIIKEKLDTSSAKVSKTEMGFPLNKIVITLGYNAVPAQHQDLLISYLNTLPVSIKNKIFIVVPMTYGRVDKNYISKVEQAMCKTDIEGLILSDYMNYIQMADLSIATDIYVNSRDTDAFSNSMKEQLFAGTIMIQGSWLEYDELDEIGWPRIIINNRSELPDKIKDIIENHPDLLNKKSCMYIWNTFSRVGVRKQWDDLYDKLWL